MDTAGAVHKESNERRKAEKKQNSLHSTARGHAETVSLPPGWQCCSC